MPRYRYPWPASAITPDEMAILYAAREASRPRVPISRLIARAVRETYGQVTATARPDMQAQSERQAA